MLARVEQAHELLDQPDLDPAELAASLAHVAQVNRWLGGTRSLVRALRPCLGQRGGTVLDVGTGNVAVPIALVQWARRRGIPLRVAACDVHPQTLALAGSNAAPYPEIMVQHGDALALPFADQAFDVSVMLLTLHHFEQSDQLRVLRELARVSRRALIVSELERGWPNYLGARLLAATWWRRNRITRHDGPLSVLRAFTPAELAALAQQARLTQVRVSRHFFFRLLLVAELDGGSAVL